VAHYFILWSFTEEGTKNLKGVIDGIEIFKANTERRGNSYHGTFYSFGQYGAISLVEADNDFATQRPLGLSSASFLRLSLFSTRISASLGY
jgi:uncharacterized protein with GYD domain